MKKVENVYIKKGMKKICVLFLLFFLTFSCITHTLSDKKIINPTILSYAGTYSYGQDVEKGGVGTILIYPETDSTVLFYVDVCRGAPSYNMGSLYGRVKIIDDSGVFYTKYDFSEIGCKWKFQFSKNILSIKTIDSQCDCGFGNAVFVDGDYKKNSDAIPMYFKNMDSKKIFFRNTKPEYYIDE